MEGKLSRKICYPPDRRAEQSADGQGGQDSNEEEWNTSNKISYGHSIGSEIQMFALSQIRVSNLFFLFISVLDQFYKESPLGKISTILPLILVIIVQAVIAAVAYFKDERRVQEVNERADFRLAEIPKGGGPPKFLKRSLDHVKPGDLLSFEPKLGEKVYVPADMVLVAVACTCHRHLRKDGNPHTCGRCSVCFSNLTGELQGMERQAPERTSYWNVNNFNNMKATVEVEEPQTHQKDLEAFRGNLNIGRHPIKLTGMNFVPRGSLIYNAEMVYAIVVYTGNDTKVAFHLKEKETWKSKRVPIMDDMMDKVFLALIYLIFVASLLFECFQYFTTTDKTFKPFEWINLLQRCIPISLMLLLEIINFAITYRITKNKKASPFSHKATSELGHVTHMVLDRNTICGNHLEVEMLATQHAQEQMMAGETGRNIRPTSVAPPRPGTVDSVRRGAEGNSHIRLSTTVHDTYLEDHDTAKIALAICHRDEEKTEDIREGEDARTEEAAMIKTAARLGYFVEQRTSKEIRLKKKLKNGKLEEKHFEILEMIPFSPEDNMIGMFVQETGKGTGAVNRLFLKGTKEAFEFLKETKEKELTENPVPDFTARGLKTVFFAEAKLSNEKWEKLREFVDDINYRRDKNSEKVKRLRSEFFPNSLRVIGSVGLKLVISKEVKEILANFKKAGIHLTLTNEADHLANKPLVNELPCFDEDNTFNIDENEDKEMDIVLTRMRNKPDQEICLTMSGNACERILKMNKDKLQRLLRNCSLTILSQMTPELKATIVDLMSERTDFSLGQRFWRFFNPIQQRHSSILVVGDSTDDVSMMLEADLSVYIDNGDEKCFSDANYSADFVCDDLQELEELLLVHGTINKRALSEVIFYSIYRNLIFVIVQIFFTLYLLECPYSFKVFSTRNSTWYVAYTSLPALAAGLNFKAFSKEEILDNPAIYNEPRQKVGKSKKRLAMWGLGALVHALITSACFHLYMGMSEKDINDKGEEGEEGDFANYRAYLIVAVVLTACCKISLTEGIIMPWRGCQLKPKMVLDWWMLATGVFSVALVFLLHLTPGLKAFVEKETSEFIWTNLFLCLFLNLLGAVCIDLLWHILEYGLWLRSNEGQQQQQKKNQNQV